MRSQQRLPTNTLVRLFFLLIATLHAMASFGQVSCTKRLIAGRWECLYRFADTGNLDIPKVLASMSEYLEFVERPNSLYLDDSMSYSASGPYFAIADQSAPTSEGRYRLDEKTCMLRLGKGYEKKMKGGRDWHIVYIDVKRMIARSSSPKGTFIYVLRQPGSNNAPPPGG